MTAETQTPEPSPEPGSINQAASIGKELTFGERQRASDAAYEEYKLKQAAKRQDVAITTIHPSEVDVSAPLSERLAGEIGKPEDIELNFGTQPAQPLSERQQVIHDALWAPIDDLPAPEPSSDWINKPTVPAPTVIHAGEVDLTQPLSPFLQGGIGKPEDANLQQTLPVEPRISTKGDKHPDQAAAEQRAAAYKASLPEVEIAAD